jgi:hypothetical protein
MTIAKVKKIFRTKIKEIKLFNDNGSVTLENNSEKFTEKSREGNIYVSKKMNTLDDILFEISKEYINCELLTVDNKKIENFKLN